MKYGEVFDYRNAEEANQYIGKKGVFSDSLRDISDMPECCDILILRDIEGVVSYPFACDRDLFQFFRPLLEDEELMTNRQLAEWLAKGNGEFFCEGGQIASSNFVYYKAEGDSSVSASTLIRRWGDTEWSKPTKAIYEEDCMPNTAINKEDCR